MSSKKSAKSPLKSSTPLILKWCRGSATLFTARVTAASGFVTAVIGGLDWSPLMGISGLDQRQVITMGAIILLIGISHEVARRRTLDA